MLKKCIADPDAVIDADLSIFYPEADFDKLSAVKQLVVSLGMEEDIKVQKISFKNKHNYSHFLSIPHCQQLPKIT